MDKENKAKKILFNEVSFVVAAVGFISSIIFWVQNPQKTLEIKIIQLESKIEATETVTAALEKIKNNDLHEIQLRMDRQETRQIELLQGMARLEALFKPLQQ